MKSPLGRDIPQPILTFVLTRQEWGKDFDDPGNTHFVGNTIYMPTLLMILLVVLWPLPTTRIELSRYFQKIWLYSLLYMTALNVNESQLIYPIYPLVQITYAFAHGSGYPRIVELETFI
jgi:hypothetical protein